MGLLMVECLFERSIDISFAIFLLSIVRAKVIPTINVSCYFNFPALKILVDTGSVYVQKLSGFANYSLFVLSSKGDLAAHSGVS